MVFTSYFNYKFIYFVAMNLCEIFVFILLGMYIDQIIPSELGVKKHPLFFLGIKSNAAVSRRKVSEVSQSIEKSNVFENIGGALEVQRNN